MVRIKCSEEVHVKATTKYQMKYRTKLKKQLKALFWDAGLKTRFQTVYTGNVSLWGIACGKNKMQPRGTK